jgi:Ser/Thr protein kinase RdoA (MazF antagonist)
VQTTHDLVAGADTVTKTFRLRHGDEADREWSALALLERHAAGLAPAPLARTTVDGRPAAHPGPGGRARERAGPAAHLRAARRARRAADPVFTHADGNLANLLWDGSRCRVVDFEDAGVSDRAYEVADLLKHVSASLRGLVDADELAAALGLTVVQRQRVLTARRLFATFWLLMLRPGHPGHARNPAGSLGRQAERVHALLRSR